MADQRRFAPDDRGFSDIPDRETEEIRDEKEEEDDEEFDDAEDLDDEEEDETDLGKNVLDQERGAAASRRFTDEIGSEGGSQGGTEVEREHGRRRINAGEATTTGGQPADYMRFDRRRKV
jgi:hypothetical protein